MLKYVIADVRFAMRRLRSRTSYALLAVLTLALGIGGTAAVFGVARPILFDPLPYANERELTEFWFGGSWTEQEFVYLRGKFPGYRAVAAYRPTDFTRREGDGPAQLLGGIAGSAELFDVLGAAPMAGRTFREGDDVIGAEPVAVLSYGLWQEMGGGADIVGSRITLDGTPRTVVGVMPRAFWFPSPSVRLWVPRALDPEAQNGSYTFIGHVLPGQDPAHMAPQTAQLVSIVDERFDYPSDWDKTKEAYVTPLRDAVLGPMRPAILATFVAMGLILLIACTNVAALMLGQVESRGSELAVRAALGAGRHRLTQPLVVEAVLIGVLAAVLGAALAALGFDLLAGSLPIGAWADAASFDWTLFAMALGVAIVASLLVVIIPSTSIVGHDARGDLHAALSRARTGGVGGGRGRLERALVVVEVALAMLIASGATLLVRSVSNLYAIDPGIETQGIAVVEAYSSQGLGSADRRVKIEAVIDELKTLPGVASVGATMKAPLGGPGDSFGITVPGRSDVEQTTTYFRIVTTGYFETMGMRLARGRTFDGSDQPGGGEMSVVVNEALAAKYFPGEDAVGKLIGGGFSVPQRIVGVVENVAEATLTDERTPVRYFLAGQAPWFGIRAMLMLRMNDPAADAGVLDAARRAVHRVAPEFAVQRTTTMSRLFDEAVGPARQLMALLALLSALALVLGAVGIYGVISHFAQRRMRDWAIRVALGLPGRRVIATIVAQGAALVATGILIGGLATVALSRLLTSFLHDVSGADPIAFLAASAALLGAGLIAAFVPARRAGTVDPAMVLREDA